MIRLLQGSESESLLNSYETLGAGHSIIKMDSWITEAKKVQIKGRLSGLKVQGPSSTFFCAISVLIFYL